jgi:hypothetical protein
VPRRSFTSRVYIAGSVSGPVAPKNIGCVLASSMLATAERAYNTPMPVSRMMLPIQANRTASKRACDLSA